MTKGVLLMAYGTPESPDQVKPYFTHIRGGRPPSPEAVARLQHRYERVGGRTPLLDITTSVQRELQRELNTRGRNGGYRVYLGMKHWHPFIGEVLPQVVRDGISDLVALPLAPHYSRLSIGGYRQAVDDAMSGVRTAVDLRFVDSWHLNPLFLELVARRVRESLAQWPAGPRADVVTVFSAHSLPERIREWDDPYESQLLESCRAVAKLAAIGNWRFAWQSAGDTGEPWLGPDIGDVLEALHRDGVRHVLAVPIGFVCDHLEILYDIDYEAQRRAHALGMTLRRSRMPNADPAFVRSLASVVEEAW